MKKFKIILSIIVILILVLLSITIKQAYFRHILITACIFGSLAQFYNITYGFVGIFNFGYAAFFGIGAYASAILATDLGVPVFLAMLLATAMSALLGLLIMIPCLRMHNFTIGIVTLAFGEIARIVVSAAEFTNGEMGYWRIVPLFKTDQAYAVFAVCMGILTMIGIAAMMGSKTGLAFRMIKDDALAAESIGSNVKKYKLSAMAISCAGAGFVGSFYAHYLLTITPHVFGLRYTTEVLCMSLFGGLSTIIGPAIGGVTLTVLTEALRFLDKFRLLIYGVLLVLVIMFFPKGLMGIWEKVKYWRSARKMDEGAMTDHVEN